MLLRCECLGDGVEVETLLVTHLDAATSLTSSLALSINFMFVRGKFLASISVTIFTIATLALAVTTTNIIVSSVVLSAIIAS
jgi:hypothetical protein